MTNTNLSIASIIADNYAEIAEIAATLDIDWNAHCSEPLPFKLNSTQTKTLSKVTRGKSGIIADIKFTKTGQAYPFLYFRTFKGGENYATWSGYKALKDHKVDESQLRLAKEAQKANIEVKLAKEAQELETVKANRRASLATWNNLNEATESSYLDKKKLADYLYLFREGTDLNGTFIAHPLFNEFFEQVGYERIYYNCKKVSKGSGHTGLYFGKITANSTKTDIAIITEGYADALTAHHLTAYDAYAAISASNVPKLACVLQKHGYKNILVLADNDRAGINAARKCKAINNSVVRCTKPTQLKDFSDVFVIKGIAEFGRELLANIFLTTQNSRYINTEIKTNNVNILLSEKGTGKTTTIAQLVSSDTDASVLVISHRQALASQMARDFEIDDYQDIKAVNTKYGLADKKRLVVSPESIIYLDPKRQYDIVFIDEAEQLLQHATTSSTMSNNNKSAVDWIISICVNAKTLVLADANADAAVNKLAQIVSRTGKKDVITIANSYKPRAMRGDNSVIYKDEDTVLSLFEANCAHKKKSFFATDSRALAERVHAMASKHGNSLLITSKTRAQHLVGLSNINEYLIQFDSVIYSPSLGTGFSIDEGHTFDVGFAVFRGQSNTAESCSQMLARFRGVSEYHMFIGQHIEDVSINYNELRKNFIQDPCFFKQKTGVDYTIDANGNVVIDKFSSLYLHCLAAKNASKLNFNKRVRAVLVDEGFTLIDSDKTLLLSNEALNAINEVKKNKKEQKETKLNDRAINLNEGNNLRDIDALELAKHEAKYFGCIERINFAKMQNDTALQLDKLEADKVKRDELALIHLTHYSYKKHVVLNALEFLGINHADMTKKKVKIFTQSDCKNLARQEFYTSIYSAFRVSMPDANKQPVKALRNLCKLLGIKVNRFGKDKNKYIIDNSSLIYMQKLSEIHGKIN